jgi:hypothetical protein
MAIINAANNGNWSNSNTWPSGIFPTSNDDVYANTRTVYIDQNINVNSLNTTAGTGGTAGGLFYNTGSISITAGTIMPGTTNVLTLTGNNNINIQSSLISGSYTTTNTWGIIMIGASPAPTVTINSYISGGSFAGTTGGIRQEAGNLNVSGTIVGGSANSTCPAIYIINVGNYPVVFNGVGSVVGSRRIQLGAGINITYVGQEFSNKNSSFTFTGIVSGSPLISDQNNQTSAAMRINTTIPVFINGDVIGGSGGFSTFGGTIQNSGQAAVYIEGNSVVTLSGNVYSGVANLSGSSFESIYVRGPSPTLNIIGNIVNVETLGTGNGCLDFGSTTGFFNLTGNIISSSGTRNVARVVGVGNTNTFTMYGNISANRSIGLTMANNSTVNIYGDVYAGNTSGSGGTGSAGIVISSGARGKLNVYGTVNSGNANFSHGIGYGSSVVTSIYAKKLKGGVYGIGSGTGTPLTYAIGATQNVVSLPTMNIVCEELEFGRYGAPPVLLNVCFADKSFNTITMPVTSTTAEIKTLVDPNFNNIMPSVSDVRLETIYSAGNLIGTCNIPPIENVEFKVPVDNSYGIAALTPQSIWNTTTTQLTSLSTSIGYRLNNAATVESVGQQVAAFGA